MKRRVEASLLAYNALSMRERLLVAFAILAALFFAFQFFLFDPAEKRAAAVRLRIEGDKAILSQETAQVVALENQLRERERAFKNQLGGLQERLLRQDEQFKAVEASLVSPREMPRLLQGLLGKRSGLQLLSLRSLAPQPVAEGQEAAAGASKGQEVPRSEGRFYRHGVEVSVQGRYGDLLAYVEELEKMPQKMLWQELHFKVEEYPRTTLSFTVHTLSLETTWLQM